AAAVAAVAAAAAAAEFAGADRSRNDSGEALSPLPP
ncbi:unnamed protein product, partial [Hapterophycus canaliculatus]